jgi:hypothetical protein
MAVPMLAQNAFKWNHLNKAILRRLKVLERPLCVDSDARRSSIGAARVAPPLRPGPVPPGNSRLPGPRERRSVVLLLEDATGPARPLLLETNLAATQIDICSLHHLSGPLSGLTACRL